MSFLLLASMGVLSVFTQANASVYQINLGEKYCLRVLENGPEPCNASDSRTQLTHLDFFDSIHHFVSGHNYCPVKKMDLAVYNKNAIQNNIENESIRIKSNPYGLDAFIKSQRNMYAEYNNDCSFSVVFQSMVEAEYPGYCYQDLRGDAQNFEGKTRCGTVMDGYYIHSKIYKFYITKVDGSEVEYSDEEKEEYYKPESIRGSYQYQEVK
jgi:hypothetical protein